MGTAGGDAPIHAEDAIDSLYVRDCARAIALLQTADRLHHRVYNVGGGRATNNAEVAAALRGAVPGIEIDLLPGHSPERPVDQHMSIERLQGDTGYRPRFSLAEGIDEYVDWLRAGNPR